MIDIIETAAFAAIGFFIGWVGVEWAIRIISRYAHKESHK